MPKSHSEDFFPEMSNLKDEQLHILRGHLLIEKKLRELIDLKVERPDALSEAKLSFHQILCITEALYWENDSDRLWQSIRKLNNIRNSFSHQLEPKKYDDIINEFLDICGAKKPYEFSTKSTLVLAMNSIYCNLDKYVSTFIKIR
jgi:hypothetical protein